MREKLGWVAVGLFAVAFLLRVRGPLETLSQNVDEPYHIGSAVSMFEAKVYVLGVEQPPLTRWVSGVPLMLMGAELPEYRGTTASRKGDMAFAAGVKVLCDGDRARYFHLLVGARWAMTIFPVVAIVYAFLLGRKFAGMLAGVMAAGLASCDPAILGHGFWVCTDGAAAAGVLAVLFHAARMIERPSRRRVIAAGIAVGLALACKFSVVVVLPALLVAHVVARLKYGVPRIKISRWAMLLFVAFMALWATYFFRIGTLGNSDTLASAPQWSRIPAWVKSVPVPMPAMWIGLGRLAAHSAQGHGTELFGRMSDRGWWYYFAVVVATKTPLVMLFLAMAGARAAMRGETASRDGPAFSREPSRGLGAAWLLVWPAAFFFVISSLGSIQIGIRHVLPVTLCGAVLGGIWLSRKSWKVGATLLVLLLAESWPLGQEYIGYYNAAGRPWGDKIALGSNYDWGQDLAKLAEPQWSVDAIYSLGDRQVPLFKTLGLDHALWDAPAKPGTRVAVSLTRRLIGPGDFEFLKGAKKVGRVGDGFDVFEIPASPGSN